MVNIKQAIIDIIVFGAIPTVLATLFISGLVNLYKFFTKPKLRLYFSEALTFDVLPAVNLRPPNMTIYTHLIIENIRPSMAQGCKVFLLNLEQKKNGSFQRVKGFNVHQTLKWAHENEPKGYEGLEIPGKYYRKVDLIHIPQNSNDFLLFIEAGPRGIKSNFPPGEYRFVIQVAGVNTNTITKTLLVSWNGEWDRKGIKVREERNGTLKSGKWTPKTQLGFSIMVGIIFTLFGFIGSIVANFVWWYQERHPNTLVTTGVVAIIIFFGLTAFLWFNSKKLLG